MMNVQVFNNEEFGQVRTLEIDGMVYFVGKDVAEVLGYTNSRKAIRDHVDDEDKTDEVTIRDAIGRKQRPIIINESGLYSLVIESKMKKAKAFRRWVTSEVLPTIRKHGSYVAPVNPLVSTEDAFIQLFQTQKEIKQEQAVMTRRIKALAMYEVTAKKDKQMKPFSPERPCRLIVTVYKPTNRRLDTPNLYPTVKALVDGMTEAKIWTDDNDDVIKSTKFQLGGLSGKKGYYRFVLTVEEVSDV